MDLKAWLEQQERTRPESEWPRSLYGIRFAAGAIWQRPQHRYYTDHSVDHSERIIEKLGKLTEDLIRVDSISPVEVYILLASAYLHDIGMQDETFKGWNLDQIRIHHHELTRKIITDRKIPLGLEQVPDEIVVTIASVAEAHRQTNLREGQYKEFAYNDRMIRPQLLAALLRLADELDIDHRRVHMQLLSLMDISAKSEFHWCLCYYVSGVYIQNGSITVHYQFPEGSSNYDRIIVPLVRGKIQEEFPTLQTILWDHGCKVQMNDRCEVRPVPGLRGMSPEVIEIALGESKEKHMQQVAYHEEEIDFCDSMAQTGPKHARVESSDE